MNAQFNVWPTSGPGCWRIQPDGRPYPGLPAALTAVRAAWPDRPDLQALAWKLLPRLPGKPRTSASLKTESASSAHNALEDVILSDPWLAMNTENAVNVLWSETDKPGLDERLALMRDWGVPVQAWKVCGAVGGHVGYTIEEPVVTGLPGHGQQDRKRLRKLSLVRSYLTTAIDGDHYAGLRGMTKNPFSPRWDVEVGNLTPVKLDDILVPLQAMAKALGWKAPKRRFRRDRKREPSPEGRNCALFDLVRWWAGDGYVRDSTAILDKAIQLNADFAVPLGHGEVACVARSITRFMVNRYDGRGQHVPMKPEEVKVRQAAAGRATATARAISRDERLIAALDRLQAQGTPPGQREIAAEAGVSLSTVKAVWAMLWDRFVNNSQVAPPVSDSSATTTPERSAPVTEPPQATTSEHAKPALVQLVGGDPSLDPRFLSPKAKAAIAKWTRESWHREKAKGGSLTYGQACAARWRGLHSERGSHLADLQANLDRMVDRAETAAWPDLAGLAAAQERLRLARLGWASRLAAEERIEARTRAAMPEPTGKPAPRFRTALDGLDLFLGVPNTKAA